jgi:hypothetical protein
MSRPAERVVAFYNKRGTCEQWIKEGKGAIKWTRLSCRTQSPPTRSGSTSCTRLQGLRPNARENGQISRSTTASARFP